MKIQRKARRPFGRRGVAGAVALGVMLLAGTTLARAGRTDLEPDYVF